MKSWRRRAENFDTGEGTWTVVYENNDFRAWVDGASIQIKAVTAHGDPVDFGTGEVRAIIAALTGIVKEIDGEEW